MCAQMTYGQIYNNDEANQRANKTMEQWYNKGDVTYHKYHSGVLDVYIVWPKFVNDKGQILLDFRPLPIRWAGQLFVQTKARVGRRKYRDDWACLDDPCDRLYSVLNTTDNDSNKDYGNSC